MPTIITHAAVPLTLGIALGSKRISRCLLMAGMVAVAKDPGTFFEKVRGRHA
jgi:hypothetical protein